MKLKLFMLPACTAFVLMLSSCASPQIEDMDILTTYFADAAENKIKLGGGVANVRTLSDSMADNPVSLIFATGESISEAEDRLVKSADHPLFFGGIRAVVVSESFAKKGIEEFIQSIKTDYKLRSESMFFITKSDAEKIVKHKAINDFTGGFAAESLLNALDEEGRIVEANLSDVFEMMSVKKVGLAVAEIEIEDDIMRFDGYGIFDAAKLVGFAEGNTADGINIFLNKNACYDFYIDKKKYTVKKTNEKKNALLKDGKLSFDITLDFECTGAALSQNVADKIRKELKNKAESAFLYAKETGCDFLKLYRIYQRDYRFEFENADYNKQLKKAEFDLKVNVRKGNGNE